MNTNGIKVALVALAFGLKERGLALPDEAPAQGGGMGPGGGMGGMGPGGGMGGGRGR